MIDENNNGIFWISFNKKNACLLHSLCFSHTRIDEKKYINIPLEIPTLRIIKQECFISIKTQTQRRMSKLILPTKKTKKIF